LGAERATEELQLLGSSVHKDIAVPDLSRTVLKKVSRFSILLGISCLSPVTAILTSEGVLLSKDG
jgi:hypothetical protein